MRSGPITKPQPTRFNALLLLATSNAIPITRQGMSKPPIVTAMETKESAAHTKSEIKSRGSLVTSSSRSSRSCSEFIDVQFGSPQDALLFHLKLFCPENRQTFKIKAPLQRQTGTIWEKF